MASQTDIKSFKARIEREKEYAESYLRNGNFDKLLTSAGRLLMLKGGLDEVRYQMDIPFE